MQHVQDPQGSYTLVLCGACELLFLSPLPTPQVFEAMYVGSKQFEGCDEYSGSRAETALEYYQHCVKNMLRKQRLDSSSLRTLEIGAGYAWVSKVVKALHQSNVTVAQDVSSEAVNLCPWVDHYVVGAIKEVSDSLAGQAPYHIISLTHVIEHVPDPLTVLRHCGRWLDRNGLVFITAPHRPPGWDKTKPFAAWQQWALTHVPAHLQYFGKRSLDKAAALSGLKIAFFIASHEEGAFEVWMGRREALRRNAGALSAFYERVRSLLSSRPRALL